MDQFTRDLRCAGIAAKGSKNRVAAHPRNIAEVDPAKGARSLCPGETASLHHFRHGFPLGAGEGTGIEMENRQFLPRRPGAGRDPSLHRFGFASYTNDIPSRAAERWTPASAGEASEEAELRYIHKLSAVPEK
jgi:hypothetical protein